MFWDCTFAQNCWNSIIPDKERGSSFYDEASLARNRLPNGIQMEIIIMGCWNIWNERNKMFKNERASLQSWKKQVRRDNCDHS
jgi:hypothetical protein